MASTEFQTFDFLRKHPGEKICMGCLIKELPVKLSRVQEACQRLEGKPGIIRIYNTCSFCKKNKLIIQLAAE